MTSSEEFERDMLVKEADWVWSEMQDFIRLVQRYRYTYVAALFAAVGWVLGQAVGGPKNSLFGLATRPDIAGILCLLSMINGVFTLLIMEAARKVQTLARYRVILATRLGREQPIWRWELFRRSGEEGSIRVWENPTNILFGVLNVTVSASCLTLARQATAENLSVSFLWVGSVVFFALVVCAVAWAGWVRRKENEIADPLTTTYDDLRTRSSKR